ncbi:MAG: competence/damage-inducible protein A [Bacteroidales bacterium]|nr:competence/damage-inducible protein A [Bacteroidales bacterium]
MLAEIITIGDELLIGQVIDTNSAWMAEQLNVIGIKVHQITSISDDQQHILTTLKEASERAQLILITGGLGPTKDDITKQTLCKYFDTSLVFSETAYANVEKLFSARGVAVTELNRLQAMVPANCRVVANPNGTAPCMWFEKNGCIYISMPGVPFEMKAIMEQEIIPQLLTKLNRVIIHRTLLTEGVGESHLASLIEPWEESLPSFVKLAYLPQPGMVRLRLTAYGTDRKVLQNAIDKAEKELYPYAGNFIFGFDNDTMESVVGQLLRSKGMTLSTAESCTGGNIAQLITSIAGSSDYFKGSIVAYSNEIKEQFLGVPHKVIAENGAVSEQTVIAMAEGIRTRFLTDFAISVSGIAGPGGGTAEKPVGTTWIAIATPTETIARKFLLGDHRGRNIRKASMAALNMLRGKLAE